MSPWAKLKGQATPQVVTGLFSKRDAAGHIASGTHHVHSSKLGLRDPAYLVTEKIISASKPHPYPWERLEGATTYELLSSRNRHDVIRSIVEEQIPGGKRETREKVEGVIEELATNALYHSYRDAKGNPRFPRRSPVELKESEKIVFRVKCAEEGLFLSIRDQGGSFNFDRVASSFRRCYGSAQQQIEAKEGGAGLGLYMVFEAVTHLKVICASGRYTEISCWIADHRSFDPDHFSFNFFEWR